MKATLRGISARSCVSFLAPDVQLTSVPLSRDPGAGAKTASGALGGWSEEECWQSCEGGRGGGGRQGEAVRGSYLRVPSSTLEVAGRTPCQLELASRLTHALHRLQAEEGAPCTSERCRGGQGEAHCPAKEAFRGGEAN